jgi:hypothetical protein
MVFGESGYEDHAIRDSTIFAQQDGNGFLLNLRDSNDTSAIFKCYDFKCF